MLITGFISQTTRNILQGGLQKQYVSTTPILMEDDGDAGEGGGGGRCGAMFLGGGRD